MSHLVQIPEAVRIAAATAGVEPELKQQAIDYLGKVKELCEETYQDCLSLYLQGAGAAGPGQVGKDGKEKLSTELRMFCEQVFEAALIQKSDKIPAESLQAMYNALVSFVTTEWVEGSREAGQSYLRNKLAYDLAHLFIDSYPSTIPSFLHPFFPLLQSDHHDPVYLVIHLLNEIALEIHDSTMRSARPFSQTRFLRDGNIRDSIRSSGDEASAVQGMLQVAQRALDQGGKWLDVGDFAMKTLATWTPWVELSVSLNPQTLAFYHQLLTNDRLRVSAAGILRTFVSKGIKEPADKLQLMKVLDIITTIDPLEASTRGSADEDVVAFRVALGSVLAAYGVDLIEMWDNEEYPEDIRKEAESMIDASRPLLLRFMSDTHHEVPNSASPFVRDLLGIYKRLHVAKQPVLRPGKNQPPPTPAAPIQELPAERRAFLAQLLDVSVRQLAWPADAEWEAPSDDPDPEDDLAMLQAKRVMCRSFIESISQIEKALHTEVVANIVMTTLTALKSGQQVPWQQAELAVHLVYTFGELSKNNTRAAFFELPAEIATKAGRDRTQRINVNKAHYSASGRSTPEMTDDQLAEPIPGLHYKFERIDYDSYALTPLGHLLALCIESNIVSFPHPSVTLQFFEAVIRYVEFFRSKHNTIKPMFEALLDQRGIHHPDEAVRRRCFYLFGKFVRDCKNDVEPDMIPVILDSIKDLLTVQVEALDTDTPDEDPLIKATTGKSYFMDQLYLFEAAGALVYVTRSDAGRQIPLLEAVAGPLMQGLGSALQAGGPQAVLSVHHHLLALGNFAKGFPQVGEEQLETLPYQAPFKQMTEALLQALESMKTQRVVRDSARFAFSQFVNAIGTTVAELVPQFVQKVVTEFEPAELIDFMTFLGLLIHRLKRNTFETMDMLLLPLLSRIFAVLQQDITGTDDASMHRKLKESYLNFFIALMNANLDGVFISDRNKPEFENLLSAVLAQTSDNSDQTCQRLAFGFFGKTVIAWATSGEHPDAFAESALSEKSKNVANGLSGATNQHAIPRAERAGMRLEGYENFVYQRLVPACFEVPASPQFNLRSNQPVVLEMAMLLRNTLQARGLEMVEFLRTDLLPKMNCPQNYADELIKQMRTQQARDFKKTFADFLKAVKGGK